MAARVPRRIRAGETDVWIGAGLLEAEPGRLVSPSGRYFLVSSAGPRSTAALLRSRLAGKLAADIQILDSEEAKTFEAAGRLADALLEAGVRRDDAVVAVGGGVVSDIAGFAAAVVLRGIAWNAVATTTGSMADAAIGGKTGVDSRHGKNLIGAFHPPRTVLADLAALATLPDRELRAGLVEAVKAAWIGDAELAATAEATLEAALARDEEPLLNLIAGAAAIKARIVGEDPREGDRRRLLNFGHTLGHAFEAAGRYRDLKHGEAVAWGIAGAVELSRSRAGLSETDARRILSTLERLGPFPEPVRDAAALEPYLARDKKATASGLAAVLLEGIGRPRIEPVPVSDWLAAASRISLGGSDFASNPARGGV
jgi:3-dehydroquinate synthase